MIKKSSGVDLPSLKETILPVLVVVFGLQLIRSFIPGLVWYMMDTVGAGSLDLIPYALGTFLLGFLAAVLRKLLGNRGALWMTAGGAAVLRAAEQITRDPGLDFWLTIAGIGLFLNFIPLFIGWTRQSGEGSSRRWTFGLFLGLGLDTSLKGIFGPRELSTISGIVPLLIIGGMAAAIFWALWKEPNPAAGQASDARGKSSSGLLSIGCILVVQLLYFQSSGWVEEAAGLESPLGFIILALGYLAAATGLSLGYARPRLLHPAAAAIGGILFTVTTFSANQTGVFSILFLLLGQFFLGWGLAVIGLNNETGSAPGLWRTTLAVNGGMLFFLIVSFAYYLALDLALPIPRDSFPAAAAGLVLILFTIGAFQGRSRPDTAWDHTGEITAGAFTLVALICWAVWSPGPAKAEPAGFPVRVMTYNIHSAFHVDGYQDLEGIAQVIEDAGADIIGLQEVSRVRLMDGAADMPAWLSRRLDMPYLFQGTEEPIWGNAILSRYPIIESGQVGLPREDSLIGRGFLWARIDVGQQEPLLVIVTHLHQVVADVDVRKAQIPAILDFWDGRGKTVLMGDFNAKPDSEEIGLIYASGMLDAWLEAGQGLGYTDASNDPVKRIDFIWVSPDLAVNEIEVILTQASDHMPVLCSLSGTE